VLLFHPDGRILLLQRVHHKPFGGNWGLPCGKLNEGETPLDGAIRELFEETGIHLDASSLTAHEVLYVGSAEACFAYHRFHAHLDLDVLVIVNPSEHTDFDWVSPFEALRLPLVDDGAEALMRTYRSLKPL
jgi:8-oxo-dGTP pyrophosphatase MutT (NUDIX family)